MQIKTQGSNNYAANVESIMGALIKKEVQQHYSGLGRVSKGVGKRNSKKKNHECITNACACMTEFIEEKFAGGTKQLKISTVTSAWLAGVGDREGGGTKRKRGQD